MSTNEGKAFDKIRYPFMIKTPRKPPNSIDRNFLNLMNIYKKSRANITLKNETLNAFSLRLGTRQGSLLALQCWKCLPQQQDKKRKSKYIDQKRKCGILYLQMT